MALFFTVLLCAAGLALGYINYTLNQQQFLDSAESQINSEIRLLDMANHSGQLDAEIQRSIAHSNIVVLLTDAQGKKIAGNLAAEPSAVSVLREGTLGFEHTKDHHFAARVHTFPDGRRLLVGIDISRQAQEFRRLQILGFISLALMAVVIATSFLISTFVVSRTNRIANTARQMMETGDLSRRIEVDSRWDDLSNMAHVLNLFLARLEESVRGIRNVSDNIAHDLRTPLTRLRNDLEGLRQQHDVPESARQAIDEIIEDTDTLLNIFNALLRISRLEAARQTDAFAALNLAEVLHDVAELYEPLAQERSILLTSELQTSPMRGDRDLLFQIFANLLDNAIKYTPSGGQVRLLCKFHDGRAIACVSDTGPGIAPEHQARVFERFYRIESSRTSPGHGLGLSLVKAGVSLHQADIMLENINPGFSVTIIFPAAE